MRSKQVRPLFERREASAWKLSLRPEAVDEDSRPAARLRVPLLPILTIELNRGPDGLWGKS
jgi:hypothetical protein